MSRKPVLPVDEILPEIITSLKHFPNLVIEASPGDSGAKIDSCAEQPPFRTVF